MMFSDALSRRRLAPTLWTAPVHGWGELSCSVSLVECTLERLFASTVCVFGVTKEASSEKLGER